MNAVPPKVARLRLDPIAYENLRKQVLRRDGWRCQSCGAMSNLEVHHQEFRSHSGDDSELNLITLCTACHNQTHRRDSTPTFVGTRKGPSRSLKKRKAEVVALWQEPSCLSNERAEGEA